MPNQKVVAAVIGTAGVVSVPFIVWGLDRLDSEPATTASFLSPSDGDIRRAKGVLLAVGEVDHLDGQSLWLMDFDGEDYTADMKARVDGDRWMATSKPPFGRPMSLVIVTANEDCDIALAKLAAADDSTTENLPAGCQVADQVDLEIVG